MIKRLWKRITGRADDELERELRAHLELEAEESGDAYAARRLFGNTTLVKEEVRAVWGWTTVERVFEDLRLALRMMRRRPGFTAVAIVSLAVALGANTAVFSFVDAIVLNRLPVKDAGRLVTLGQKNEAFHIENCCFPYSFLRELRKRDTMFADALAVNVREVTFTDREQVERVEAEIVSGNYFSMLGVRAAAGRLFEESDDFGRGTPVCVISYAFWQERYGGSGDVIGRPVAVNGRPYRIIGVSEPGFTGAALDEPHPVMIPSAAAQEILGFERDIASWAQILARLKPGVTMQAAEAQLNIVGRQIQKEIGPKMGEHDDFLLHDGSQGIGSVKERLGRPAVVLLFLVAVVLLVACSNLTALLLVRSVERTREAGVRLALGASRWALFRQYLAESMLLAVAGGVGGWFLAGAFVPVLLALLGSASKGLAAEVQPDATVFAFSAGVTLLAGLLFGVLPAWRASHAEPMPAVRGTSGEGRTKGLVLSRAIVAGQIGLSLVLVFCGGLLVQTLRNLRSIDIGFRPENLAILSVNLSQTAEGGERAGAFFEELLTRARALPGARSASLASISVLSGSMQSIVVRIPGYVEPSGLMPTTYFTGISSGYFRTLGIPLLAGRDFTEQDRGGGGPAPVIVNAQFARQFLEGDALGKVFRYGGGREARVVGVAGTSKFRWLREEAQPVLYLPLGGSNRESLHLHVRSAGEPMTGPLRELVRSINPNVPGGELTTMEMQIDQALARERMLAFLSTGLGGIAVALAAIGLYGVLSFSVVRRTREIGIRMAIGAMRQRILMQFLRESAWTLAAGIAIGIPAALGCGQLLASLLYGLEPGDLPTVAMATMVLALVALAAALAPAWRASRIDAMAALRHE